MRSGICSIQQALTPEAATTVRQAVSLARRRGHAQVTPLHVASVMLASSTGLLRRACLQTHSHPLQCKALELCFNVALNRLPTSTSSPLVGHHPSYPSVSNALVAAFKRAQAHQRRGSIENQQQPILALKIEKEQLVISILDDPSVSRVMREAGFSSTLIKNNVEHAISMEVSSQSSPPPVSSLPKENNNTLVLGSNVSQSLPFGQFAPTFSKPFEHVRNEDINSVLDEMAKKRNTVIVGECLSSSEAVVKSMIKMFERRDDVPANLRYVQFINLPISSLRNLYKDDVEKKILELRCLVKNYVGRGLVLYLGDLKWISDFWSNFGDQRRGYYCPVEHMIIELKRLVSQAGESDRLWLMGIATFRTYMKCKTGYPSLEALWDLHPLTVPVGSLNLTLSFDSALETQCESKIFKDGSCRPLLDANVHGLDSSTANKESTPSSSLPLWLQKCKEESKEWNLFSTSADKDPIQRGKALNISSLSPSTSTSSSEGNPNLHWSPILETNQVSESKPELLSNPNSSPNSASSSEVEVDVEDDMFKEFTDEKLKILWNALEGRVPWQKEIIPDIASTILQCRSRILKSKHRENKEETWLFFMGADNQGKEKIAREIAKVIFGSRSNFTSISLSNFASTTADGSTEESNKKRSRDEKGCSYIERFTEAVNENPHRVFYMEDIEQVNYNSQKGIKKAIESGELTLPGGEKTSLKDAIIIFSCETFGSLQTSCENEERMHEDNEPAKKDSSSSVSLDLNIAINHGNSGDKHSAGALGILELVDRKIGFNIQKL